MQEDKPLFDVKVAGLTLKLRSSHDEETVRTLTKLVNEKIEQALAMSKNISFQNALLLASLHLAEELTLLKKRTGQELEQLEKTAHSILSDIESSPLSRLRLDN